MSTRWAAPATASHGRVRHGRGAGDRAGTGRNLSPYRNATRVGLWSPAPGCTRAEQAARAAPVAVEVADGRAEALPFLLRNRMTEIDAQITELQAVRAELAAWSTTTRRRLPGRRLGRWWCEQEFTERGTM
jgi:hypothetical protein